LNLAAARTRADFFFDLFCAGNHGIALSYASTLRGCSATIVLPWNSPTSKQDLIQEYGGKLVFCDPTVDAREATCAQVQAETGSTFIPSSNSIEVVSGQGTVALEFLEQVGGVFFKIILRVTRHKRSFCI
jgi:threonine dehydratase